MPRGRNAPPKWLQAARLREKNESADWVSRALARAGIMRPEETDRALREGRVSVDGRVVREALTPLHSDSRIEVDGHRVDVSASTRVLMFHKPAGLVSQKSDPQGQGTVFEALLRLLPPPLEHFGWHAVGRLDRDTTGLLFFTNDERFVAFATSPATHLEKCYLARVGSSATPDKVATLCSGVLLEPGVTVRAARAKAREPNLVEVVLTEGKYHQVKRMLNAVGLPTLALHREAIGAVTVDVPVGEFRALSPEEIAERLGYKVFND